jgi:hypothetical protein
LTFAIHFHRDWSLLSITTHIGYAYLKHLPAIAFHSHPIWFTNRSAFHQKHFIMPFIKSIFIYISFENAYSFGHPWVL